METSTQPTCIITIFTKSSKILTLLMQNPDIISFENRVDPDQLASAQGTLFITANKYFLHIILKINSREIEKKLW